MCVYEYYDDGEVKRYTNPVASAVQPQLGTEVTIYISEDGKVREKEYAEFMFTSGFILTFGGIVCIIAALETF